MVITPDSKVLGSWCALLPYLNLVRSVRLLKSVKRPKSFFVTGLRSGRQAHRTAHSPSTTVRIHDMAMLPFFWVVLCQYFFRRPLFSKNYRMAIRSLTIYLYSVFGLIHLYEEDHPDSTNDGDARYHILAHISGIGSRRIIHRLTIYPAERYWQSRASEEVS